MSTGHRKKTLYDAYRFSGFTPVRELRGVFGDPKARVLRLNRRSKKQSAALAAPFIAVGTTRKRDRRETFPAVTIASIWSLRSGALIVGNVKL